MLEELQQIFPNISIRQIFKLILTLKCRNKTFGKIGISRKEATRFGLSERQMRSFIDFLRDMGILELVGKAKCSSGWLCNVYKIGKEYVKEIMSVNGLMEKVFEYLNPVEFVKSNFKYKVKWGKITFKHNGNKYIVPRTGRFKDKIYGVVENKIINPYLFINKI